MRITKQTFYYIENLIKLKNPRISSYNRDDTEESACISFYGDKPSPINCYVFISGEDEPVENWHYIEMNIVHPDTAFAVVYPLKPGEAVVIIEETSSEEPIFDQHYFLNSNGFIRPQFNTKKRYVVRD